MGPVAAWLGGVHCTLYSTVQYSCTVRGGAGSQSACAAPAARSDDSEREELSVTSPVCTYTCLITVTTMGAYLITLAQPHNVTTPAPPRPPVQCSAAASTRICQRRCQLLSCPLVTSALATTPVQWPPHTPVFPGARPVCLQSLTEETA